MLLGCTHFLSWSIICIFLCKWVCLQFLPPTKRRGNVFDDNLRKPLRIIKFIFGLRSFGHFYLPLIRVKFAYEGHGVKVKGHSSKKAQNYLFLQYKTSIGNNSGSVEDSAVKFACVTGFSAMADCMMWPSSLSRERKYAYFWVVCLRRLGNLCLVRDLEWKWLGWFWWNLESRPSSVLEKIGLQTLAFPSNGRNLKKLLLRALNPSLLELSSQEDTEFMSVTSSIACA